MIKTLIRAVYSAFISFILISIVLAGWTGFVLISQSEKSIEIINVVQKIYESQKSVIIDIVDLTKLLIDDKSEISDNDNNSSTESTLLIDPQETSLIEGSSGLEDNGDNPLGIVIEPSSADVGKKTPAEISLEPLDNEDSEGSINKMKMEMEMF